MKLNSLERMLAMCAAPTKEKVREWQKKRLAEHTPPPGPDQVKRELGWGLIEAQRKARTAK